MNIRKFLHQNLKRPYRLNKTYDNGSGQPVVLLHGIASNSTIWKPLLEINDPAHRFIAFDLLGFGFSPRPDWAQYSVEEHAKAVVTSIRKMHIRKPVVLVGHSMGGIIAAHIAYHYPKLVSRLVLYQPPLLANETGIKRYDNRTSTYLRAFGYIASRQELVLKYSRVVGQKMKHKGGFNLSADEWIPFERSMRNTIMRQHAYDHVLTLKIPVDIIYGKKDRMVIRIGAKKLFANNPYVTLHTIAEKHRLNTHSAKFISSLLQT